MFWAKITSYKFKYSFGAGDSVQIKRIIVSLQKGSLS